MSITVWSNEKILFYLNNWVGDRPFARLFPDLFSFARDSQVKVSSYMKRLGNQVVPHLQEELVRI